MRPSITISTLYAISGGRISRSVATALLVANGTQSWAISDTDGNTSMFKELFALGAVAAISLSPTGSADIAAAASNKGMLTVEYANASVCQGPIHMPVPFYGYDKGLSIGSYSPIRLIGGKTVAYLGDQMPLPSCTSGIAFSAIALSGFSSNPGRHWLISVECDGITRNEDSAFQFTFLEGTAWWYWSSLFELKSKDQSNVSCTIVHD